MTLTALCALLLALSSSTASITKIVEDLRAAKHPEDAPIPDAAHAALVVALKASESQAAADAMDALDDWEADHASN